MSADPARLERRGIGWPGVLRRLLLVDKDTWCRGIADGVLRGRGYRVVCTGDLPTAIQIAREMLPDLVLADVSLSLMEPVPVQQRRRTDRAVLEPSPRLTSGYAVLRPLENDPGLANCPVVLLRDPREAEDSLGGPRFGVPDYVPKPFTPQVLLEKIEKCLHTMGVPQAAGAPRKSDTPTARIESDLWDAREVALEGRIDFMGIPAVLEMFHFNQLSGVCAVRSGDQRSAEVGFQDGEIVSASTSDGLVGNEAVFRLLSWSGGRFAFALARPVRGVPIRTRFEQLLLEGLRRLDEQRRYPTVAMDTGLLRRGWKVPES
jgi:CheY-like chemotaxis protein